MYFDDVKLQMSAKLYGAKFNAMNPPKKVDVVKVRFRLGDVDDVWHNGCL